MKLFDLCWDWHDCQSSYLFLHENKTQSEFNEDVKFLLKKYAKECIEKTEGWTGMDKLIEFVAGKLPELGYKEAEINNVIYGGSTILEKRDLEDIALTEWDKESENGWENRKEYTVKDLIGNKNWNLIIQNNKKIYDKNKVE